VYCLQNFLYDIFHLLLMKILEIILAKVWYALIIQELIYFIFLNSMYPRWPFSILVSCSIITKFYNNTMLHIFSFPQMLVFLEINNKALLRHFLFPCRVNSLSEN
jgi:hypothetical protein